MKTVKELVIVLAVLIVFGGLISYASKNGAMDRPFDVKDDITGNVHSVTEHSIETCKTMPHYAVVVLDGVERRCVQSVKWGAVTLPEKK